jgi:cytochrome d ubiquinol oxidase subunit II
MSALQVTWYFLIGLLLTVYAILDGFDLGVGFWHLFNKDDKDRRTAIKSIGPVWDGNEVWLLTGGGAIFAAFPTVYATVFSGFYLALMLLLLGLIYRAVSIEFRNKVESQSWRNTWDLAFGLGSTLVALLLGVAIGNILHGLPLDAKGNFTGTFFSLLNPYSLLIGILGLAMLATHGGIYLQLKSSDTLHQKMRSLTIKSWMVYLALYIIAMTVTLVFESRLIANYNDLPILWLLPVLALAAVVAVGIFIRKGQPGKAFIASSLSIALSMGMVGASLFPNLVPALNDPGLSLTLFNSSSSELTLKTMLILALIGMPLVLGYTGWVYKSFAGKTGAQDEGY